MEYGQGSSSRTRAWRLTFFLRTAPRSSPRTSVASHHPHRPSCDSQPPPPPRCHHHVAHHGDEDLTGRAVPYPGATADTGSYRRHHHRPPPPCPGRPWSPARVSRANPIPLHRPAPPSCPSSRPWRETRRALGNPRVSTCPVRKFFQKIIPDKKPSGCWDPWRKISKDKI